MRLLKIGASGVRGVVGDALTPELIANFACAFGTWCDGGHVVIGRDTRRSSSMVRAAVVSGLISTGCRVTDLGQAPTPVVSFATRRLGASGGISITGSHNDARWNALKFVGPEGALLNAVKTEELLDIYHASGFIMAEWSGLQRVEEQPVIFDQYLAHILGTLDVEAIRAKKYVVVADFCNGTCGGLAATMLRRLGCQLIPLNEEAQGEFAHPPAPSIANMRQLTALMRCLKSDIGAAINIDGDRIGFVTNRADPLAEEFALPLVADRVLARSPGPVVTNYSTSRMVDRVAGFHGQTVVRTTVGEGFVMDRALADGAALAGEGSGGVTIPTVSATFDALFALGTVLESMAVRDADMAEIAGRIPRFCIRKGELAYDPEMIYKVLDAFRSFYSRHEPDCTDGVRVEVPEGWLHARASNTEPLLRIIVEGESQADADRIFESAMTLARRIAYGHGGG